MITSLAPYQSSSTMEPSATLMMAAVSTARAKVRLGGGAEGPFGGRREDGLAGAFLHVGLHRGHGVEPLLGEGGRIGQRVLGLARQAAHLAPVDDQRQHHQRNGEQRQPRQLRTGVAPS